MLTIGACSFDDEKRMPDSKAEKQREDVITEPGAESSGNSGAGLDRVYGSPSNSGNTG